MIDCTADCVDYDGNTPDKCAGSCGFTGLSGHFSGATRDSCSQCGTLSVGSKDQTIIVDATARACETIDGHIYAFSLATEQCARFTSQGDARFQFGEEPASDAGCLIVKNVEPVSLLVRVLSPRNEELAWVRAEGGTLSSGKCSLACP